MGRRTKYEIWVGILEVCLYTPRHQSWILRELGMKTEAVKEALNFLLERNLLNSLEKDDDNWISYHTSLKGKEALNHFYHLITHFFSNKT
ncbi:MAG: winged helix-turn-helix domain-containing protein [Promethearchaeota archaeon]